MRASDRISLIDKMGRELQARFGYAEIDIFLAHYKVEKPQCVSTNSKWVYSKEALRSVDEATLLKMAGELDVGFPTGSPAAIGDPQNWIDTTDLKMFISHLSDHRDKATRLKECLASYSISGFVAHEDIEPTLEWQAEIERALRAMDAFVAIHTRGFSESVWTQQEIGFAYARGVKIISLKMGEDPTGFISKQQALPRRDRAAEKIAEEINSILAKDERTSAKLQAAKRKILDGIPF
ncbi:MAG: toll/interleukin-1 receptor domain-containing protein [Hyphomicrobium sp.]|uniref:toll/interleukin-1 receptor domain-containing protein n=1 Tax=Hyphomicrobium sp. TaxID=82 RepID=UPI00356170A7